MSASINGLKKRSLICVYLRLSVFICGKNLTPDDNRQFPVSLLHASMQPDTISLVISHRSFSQRFQPTMINQPRIPDKETIDRHVAKMQEICQRWDGLIADLDELNTRLDADFQNSPLGALYKRRAERLASQQQKSTSQT